MSHVINTSWLFQTIYSFAKPLLNDRAYKNMVVHKKADDEKLFEVNF